MLYGPLPRINSFCNLILFGNMCDKNTQIFISHKPNHWVFTSIYFEEVNNPVGRVRSLCCYWWFNSTPQISSLYPRSNQIGFGIKNLVDMIELKVIWKVWKWGIKETIPSSQGGMEKSVFPWHYLANCTINQRSRLLNHNSSGNDSILGISEFEIF